MDTTAPTATEDGIEYARRIYAEKKATGCCMECWGHGTITVTYYSHRHGIHTDRQDTCPKCGGTGKAR
jgi:DnaJ-class molecular chaperone